MSNAYNNASLIVPAANYEAGTIFSLVPTDGSGDLSFSRAGSKMRRNSAGLWETIGTNIPPLHYPVGGGCPSWLFEAEATNEALYSNQIDDAYWGKLDIAITANAAIAPDGTTTAESAVLSGTSTTPRTINRNAGVSVANATITFSCFVKYVDKQFIQLVFSSAFSSEYANFDLQNGTVTSGTYAAATIENNGNGWYRISVTTTGINTTCIPFIWAIDAGNAARAADSTSNGTQSYLLWNIQIEIGSTATSPIITAGSSVTRLKDVPSKTGISALIGQTEGSIFFDVTIGQSFSDGIIRTIALLYAASDADSIAIYRINNNIILDILVGGVAQANGSVYAITSFNTRLKGCITYQVNSVKSFINGALSVTDTASLIPACSKLDEGNYITNFQYNGEIKDVILYQTALSDSEAIELTTL